MEPVNIFELVLSTWRSKVGRLHLTPSGWWSGNAVCCHHRGETRDKRGRGGLIDDHIGGFTWHCFNCNFATKFELGKVAGVKTQQLFKWLGIDDDTIKKINFSSIQYRSVSDIAQTIKKTQVVKYFERHHLPPGTRDLRPDDTKFVNFLESRGLKLTDYPFKLTPGGVGRNKNRIIIPYIYKNNIVGWTSRYIDKNYPKYINEHQQVGFIFGLDFQKESWNYAIISEGPMDAISIQGLALMHNEFSEGQLIRLRRMHKEIIVVPDQDKAGIKLVNEAINEGFSVSMPEWGVNDKNEPISDINEAVQKYGKVATLLSIIQAKEKSKIAITMAVSKVKRRLNI